MEILYISSACCKENIDEINKTAIEKLKTSIINFHNLIIDGLAKQDNSKIKSLIGLPVSIKTNKKICWKEKINCINNITYQQVGFINFPIVKQYTVNSRIEKSAKKWIKATNNTERYIIIDASYATVVPTIVKLAKKHNINVIGIFADLYNYMCDVERKNIKNESFIVKRIRNRMKKAYSNMQGYVFLTEEMNKKINLYKKKYIVMEGLVGDKIREIKESKSEEKIIFYAGGLKKEYGVQALLDAFENLNCKGVKLWICGTGELKPHIIERTKKNYNIKYLGSIPNKEVLKIERQAFLLVNPRFSNQEYTKYSFPSKIMEYLLSGTPVLTTKLPGMPKEYYEYVYLIKEESAEGIKEALGDLVCKDRDELFEKGRKAQEFVMKEKNYIVQTNKIIQFVKNCAMEDNG